MEVKRLTDQYTVSGQLSVEDLDLLAEQGVQVLINNRPDGEAPDQPEYAEIAKKAMDLGIETYNIPFTGGQLTQSDVVAFKAALDKGKRTHAYCRTGNRCTIIWEESKKL